MALLEITNLHTQYGAIHALKGLSLHVGRGEIVTLIGANGAGKSTTLNTICGLLHPTEGTIQLDGEWIHTLPAHEIVLRGVAQAIPIPPELASIGLYAQEQAAASLVTRGRPGRYWEQLGPEEAAANDALYQRGRTASERARLVRKYTPRYGAERAEEYADRELLRRANARAARAHQRAQARRAEAMSVVDRLGVEAESAAAFEALTARSSMPLLTAGPELPLLPPGEQEAILLGSGQDDIPFYARYGLRKSPQEVEILAKRLGAYPEEVQQAIQVLMTEFPEYISDHLGRGIGNKQAFEEWKMGLSDERRAQFEQNWGIVFGDQKAHPEGSGAIRYMVDAAGKRWEGYEQHERYPMARTQDNSWVGTAVGGKVFINPNAKLVSLDELLGSIAASQNRDPAYLVKLLATKTSAVIAHEAGHLRFDELTPEAQAEFERLYGQAQEAGVSMASKYDPRNNLREEFAYQNMLFQMGGKKDKRWRAFQKRHFAPFAEFFESIAEQPGMRKAFSVVRGRPSAFGQMSIPLDPDMSSEEMQQLLGISAADFKKIADAAAERDAAIAVPEGQEAGVTPAQAKKIAEDAASKAAKKVAREPESRAAVLNAPAQVGDPNLTPGSPRVPPPGTPAPVPRSLEPRPAPDALPRRDIYPGWLAQSQELEGKAYWRGLSEAERKEFTVREDAAIAGGSRTFTAEEWETYSSSGELEASMAYAAGKNMDYEVRMQSDGGYAGSYHPLRQRPGQPEARAQVNQLSLGDLGRQFTNLTNAARISNSSALGSPTPIRANGESGPAIGLRFENFSEEEVSRGLEITRAGWDTINTGSLPDNPKDIANTLKLRLNAAATAHIEGIAAEMERAGVPEQQITEWKAKMTTLTGALAKNSISSALEAYTGEKPPGTWDRPVELRSLKALAEAQRNVPEVAAYLQDKYGGNLGAAMRGPATSITATGGVSYAFGEGAWGVQPPVGYGGDGGGGGGGASAYGGGRGGMFGGRLGSALYGAYIAKRFYSMTMQPEMMAMAAPDSCGQSWCAARIRSRLSSATSCSNAPSEDVRRASMAFRAASLSRSWRRRSSTSARLKAPSPRSARCSAPRRTSARPSITGPARRSAACPANPTSCCSASRG